MGKVSFRDFVFDVPDSVYEPAEDSFLLAGFSKGLAGDVLDVGCGCGIQAIVARKANALGVDISPDAVKAARKNAKTNKSRARFLVSDLFGGIPNKKFDCIIFNPPYLPTSKEEKMAGPIDSAFNGGESGREVLDRFLSEFRPFLKPKGRLLLLLSTLSDNGETKAKLEKLGFKTKELARKHVGLMEELFVIEASR